MSVDFRCQPGIRVSKLRFGDKVLVETGNAVYELELLDPRSGFVRVCSTDIALHQPRIGRFTRSAFGDISIPDWITGQMRMEIEFKNAAFHTTAVISARVDGKSANGQKWHYQVF